MKSLPRGGGGNLLKDGYLRLYDCIGLAEYMEASASMPCEFPIYTGTDGNRYYLDLPLCFFGVILEEDGKTIAAPLIWGNWTLLAFKLPNFETDSNSKLNSLRILSFSEWDIRLPGVDFTNAHYDTYLSGSPQFRFMSDYLFKSTNSEGLPDFFEMGRGKSYLAYTCKQELQPIKIGDSSPGTIGYISEEVKLTSGILDYYYDTKSHSPKIRGDIVNYNIINMLVSTPDNDFVYDMAGVDCMGIGNEYKFYQDYVYLPDVFAFERGEHTYEELAWGLIDRVQIHIKLPNYSQSSVMSTIAEVTTFDNVLYVYSSEYTGADISKVDFSGMTKYYPED